MNADILSKLKIKSVVKKNSKLQKYMDTKCLVNGQRQTTTHNYELSTTWETKPMMTS
jgi:hypothetical protein